MELPEDTEVQMPVEMRLVVGDTTILAVFPYDKKKPHTIAQVGSALQRQVYNALIIGITEAQKEGG